LTATEVTLPDSGSRLLSGCEELKRGKRAAQCKQQTRAGQDKDTRLH
jgi:hypothetical protein